MAVYRAEKIRDYTVMSNCHLRDRNLSLKAKGLLSVMLSLPDNWDYSLEGLARICKEGVASVRAAVAELEEQGYLSRRRRRLGNGKLGDCEYTIREMPNHADTAEPAGGQPTLEKPALENPVLQNPVLVFPALDNHGQSSIDLSSTEEVRTEEVSIEEASIHSSINPINTTDGMDGTAQYRETLRENIGYGDLRADYPASAEILDEIVELMAETIASAKDMIRVGGEDKPAAVVRSRLLKVNQDHIQYVLEAFTRNTAKVRNIRSYLLTAVYNSPATIASYYRARVNHEIFGDGG